MLIPSLVLKTWAVSLDVPIAYLFHTNPVLVSEAFMVGDVDVSNLKAVMDVSGFRAQFTILRD